MPPDSSLSKDRTKTAGLRCQSELLRSENFYSAGSGYWIGMTMIQLIKLRFIKQVLSYLLLMVSYMK